MKHRWIANRRLEDAVLVMVDLPDAMAGVSTKEALVLGLSFGLCDWRPLNLRECGELLGISREGVRQLRERALGKLAGAR